MLLLARSAAITKKPYRSTCNKNNVSLQLKARVNANMRLVYLHCLDLGAHESVQFEQFSCLQGKLVLGHVSFPEKIAERRMCGFLLQKKVIHALKDRQSPVLLEVINSCDIKVSFSGYHSLVFGLAFDCSFIVYSMLRSPFPLLSPHVH